MAATIRSKARRTASQRVCSGSGCDMVSVRSNVFIVSLGGPLRLVDVLGQPHFLEQGQELRMLLELRHALRALPEPGHRLPRIAVVQNRLDRGPVLVLGPSGLGQAAERGADRT